MGSYTICNRYTGCAGYDLMLLLWRVPFLRWSILFTTVLVGKENLAQGGVRAIFWDYENIGANAWVPSVGLGYDHDLNQRISLAGQVRLGLQANIVSIDYRSAYHFADNDGASAYMGPMISWRRFGSNRNSGSSSGNSFTTVPIGMRVGVRGGLKRFYADLFGSVSYNVGQPADAVETIGVNIVPNALSYCIGLHMGWGWDKAR